MYKKRLSQALPSLSDLISPIACQQSARPLSTRSSMSTTTSLQIPMTNPPRKRSIFEIISFEMDFTLYDDAHPSMMPFAEDALDLDDITKRGVSKAFNFAQQEYIPMYHPFDAQGAYPEPFEWEKNMFEDLGTPQRARSPSLVSISSTAPAPGSRRDSIQTAQVSSHNSSCVDSATRSCRRSSQYLAHKRLSALLSKFSFLNDADSQTGSLFRCPSQDFASTRTTRTSASVSTTPTSHSSSCCRRRARTRRTTHRNSMLLSHVGAGHSLYRMDSHSQDLQKSVANIPISAFIHPKMHIPASNDYGPVEEEGGYEDAYPLRHTRLWSFDEPELPVERCDLDRYESGALGDGLSPFAMAGVV